VNDDAVGNPPTFKRRSIMSNENNDSRELFHQALASIAHYEEAAARRIMKLGPVLRERLLQAGVARVFADYDGCGDSGCFEAISCRSATGESIDEAVSEELRQQVETYLYDLLEVRYGGWENNDGAFGVFSWDVAGDQLSHAHTTRYTETSTESYPNLDDVVRRFGGAS
jgi:hypothetical protein